MEEQKTEETNWLNKEVEELKNTSFNEDRDPALKLEENKITELTIDFSKKFDKWIDQESGIIKKIIPVEVNEVKYVWWLNVRNPIYNQIIMGGSNGQKVFKILQTGTKQNTKYTIVE